MSDPASVDSEKSLKNADEESGYKEYELESEVSFSTLPDQYANELLRKTINFNIMCIGEEGIGKSTFVSTIFETKLESNTDENRKSDNISLAEFNYDFNEGIVNLGLKVVHSVNYGKLNNEESLKPIIKHIENGYRKYLVEETRVNRKLNTYKDDRIHVVIFFISPLGLKPLDLKLFQLLSGNVNIWPIIAKADGLTKDELVHLKQETMEEIKNNNIQLSLIREGKMKNSIYDVELLSFVGSDQKVKNGNNEMVVARKYNWGTVQVHNPDHCQYTFVRKNLLCKHLEALRESTDLILYENYRKKKLENLGFINDKKTGKSKTINQRTVKSKTKYQIAKDTFMDEIKVAEEKLAERDRYIKAEYHTYTEFYKTESSRLDEEIESIRKELSSKNNK